MSWTDWLSKDKECRAVLARFLANPEGAAKALAQWLQAQNAKLPPHLANYITGGQVEKLINIAQAGVVLIHQTLGPVSRSALYQLPADILDFTGYMMLTT